MRLRAFELVEPLPELSNPHAFVSVPSWADIGSAGYLTLSCLETILGSTELARLRRPGNFFDLTRYRPILRREEDRVEVDIPNAVVTYGRQEGNHDFLFLRLPEPHMLAETYIDSVVELLNVFSVKRYCLIGSTYDMVPHTRPLLVTGGASNLALQQALDVSNVVSSDYQGPTTILYILGQKMAGLGVETLSLVVHLPNYLNPKEDYRGVARLMEILHTLYGFSISEADSERVSAQEREVDRIAEQIMQQEPRWRLVLKQLEANYDARVGKQQEEETQLSPEVERFLRELDTRFGQG
jgi:predicted ATP-grasp superfamily ATP-dependent carboligase